jgi:hypothetical protein
MRVRVSDPILVEDLVGFLQRSRCIVDVLPDRSLEVYLAHDLPPAVAYAELDSYLRLWARAHPGGSADLEAS